MSKLIDKLILLGICMTLLTSGPVTVNIIQLFLICIILSAADSYFENWRLPYPAFIYIFGAVLYPQILPAIPLFAYDLGACQGFWFLLCILPLINILANGSLLYGLSLVLFIFLALFLQKRTADLHTLRSIYHQMRDTSEESALHLQRRNTELMKKQDYEVRLATLTERNRIAREIHDNVGHLLTRSILQVSALEVIHQDNTDLSEQLSAVKCTLSDAMDNVRRSVHDLHEESVDLHISISSLIEEFHFCPVHLQYDVTEMPKEMKYGMIAIVKEALSNIARHSNATDAQILILEHPALYQLIIEDNGSKSAAEDLSGIGLTNIRDRVNAFHGVFRIDREHGFRIFISIPKERTL